ncbi:serine/threonine-protein phosphatase 5-like [Tigriopus californicus]|nr:serine/threonine-protein phosphatase 5-like [Tigriopus californicus]|eukprot:TCALIF_10497-PA protein Name:"Similar to PPP5C Serine/threonine-protein phosphatase 5 (Homo sapiens)" AED:0.11 eAED:0.11 QI:160/1/1/1/0.66/0.75/4/27/361
MPPVLIVGNEIHRGLSHPGLTTLPMIPQESPKENLRIPTPRLENGRVTQRFVDDLIDFFKQEQRLPSPTAFKILSDVTSLLREEPSLVEVQLGRDDLINICGDIHGQFFDLARIFDLRGTPSVQNQYLFNGDFVDRGPWGVEVTLVLLSYKLLYPNAFYVNRGNHECEEVNRAYGFQNEVLDKYEPKMFRAFQDAFSWLPVAHCINTAVLVMHGGLFSNDDVTLDDIRAIERGCQPERDSLMCDLLWSDPQRENGREPNSRGFSCVFGPDITQRFLTKNNLLYIVRSHECVQYGYDLCHDDTVVTVFSAPNYCDRHGNKGAICILHGDDVSMPEFKKFTAAPHPKITNLYYSNFLVRMGLL